jgi:shikimate kinase / 3-dehydroquinate synthase
VDEETAWGRAQGSPRPLAADRDEFSRRFKERRDLYESVARAILPSDARDAAGPAAPWLAAMLEAPSVRMAWAASASGSYPALVGGGAIGLIEAVDPERRLFCIADREVLTRHEGLLPPREATIQIEAGEERKTLTEAELLLRSLAEMGARRDDAILSFGGGVTGDLAGFVAATYQRGTAVVQVPTTVVAQVDSAYGGKTGVDIPEAKNYVGAYHQPSAVLADPATLATLPREEIAAGFVEVLKTALIAGGGLWETVRGLDFVALVRDGDGRELTDLIFACARTKIRVVAEDERDSGRRAVLNLGHTVGHAIETSTGYGRYRHGEAVGLGLLAALRLSDADQLRDEVSGLLAAHDLPTSLDTAVEIDGVVEAIGRDKKRTSEGVGFVLLGQPGEPRWGQSVEADRVRAAVEELR